MRKGYTITLSVLAIMILVTITVGTSYSYYSISDVQENPNTLTSTCFNVTYSDTGSNSINLENTYPMSEEKAMTLTPYTFTITNTCSAGNQTANYIVTLNTLTGDNASSLNVSYMKYKLNSTGTTGSLTTEYALNGSVKTDEGIDKSYSLETGTLAPGESKTFNLYLWIDENAGNDIMSQVFKGKVLVYSYL